MSHVLSTIYLFIVGARSSTTTYYLVLCTWYDAAHLALLYQVRIIHVIIAWVHSLYDTAAVLGCLLLADAVSGRDINK